LGVIGALIGVAYYANGRMTRLETSMEWLKEAVLELKTKSEELVKGLIEYSRVRAKDEVSKRKHARAEVESDQ
jgi:hypothetical protein